ncbi:hypothetical protein ABPG74_014750 [Tetrahymena malaccensis]
MINKNQSTSSDLSNDKFTKEGAEYKQQEKVSYTNNSIEENLLEDDSVNQKEDVYRKQKRYYFLPFACFILIGGFFNNTFQAFIKQQFMDSMGIDSSGYNLFVLIPPLPNIILPVFSGHIYNWLNLRRGLFLFSSMVLIGMTLCLIASYPKSLLLMIIGKTIHQIGNEMLCIGQSKFDLFLQFLINFERTNYLFSQKYQYRFQLRVKYQIFSQNCIYNQLLEGLKFIHSKSLQNLNQIFLVI